MSRKIYKYIDDNILIKEVSIVLHGINSAFEKIDESLFSNVVDPFSALFDASAQNISYEDWIKQEKSRQLQKTLQNTIGLFHESIIGNMDNWEHLSKGGYDVENRTAKIIAELKNKYNTMNSSSSEAVYTKMVDFLDTTKKGYTAYVVTVIPKTPNRFNRNYNPSVRGTRFPSRNDLKVVDGATFYEIATGDADALLKLYKALPSAIKKALKKTDATYKPELKNFEKLFFKAF